MMHAGPLDVGTVTLRRTIIDGHHERPLGPGLNLVATNFSTSVDSLPEFRPMLMRQS